MGVELGSDCFSKNHNNMDPVNEDGGSSGVPPIRDSTDVHFHSKGRQDPQFVNLVKERQHEIELAKRVQVGKKSNVVKLPPIEAQKAPMSLPNYQAAMNLSKNVSVHDESTAFKKTQKN